MNAEHSGSFFRVERLHLAVATVLGLGMAVVIALFAVGYGGNPVKAIMQLVGMSLMLIATVNPRAGLLLLLFSGAYLDFLKRFLILFGGASLGDVAGVLSVAPVNLFGVFLGTCVLHPIFSKRMLDKQERRLVFFSLFLIAASFVAGFRRGDLSLTALGTMANKSAYSMLVPIIFVLHRRGGTDSIRRLLRFTVLIYAPVAIYGVHQYFFGLGQFEIDYLRSGLTSTEGNLYDVHPRSFSTLNSNHAFAISMAILSLLSLVLCSRHLRSRAGFFSAKVRWLLPLVFVVACVLSFGRAGWIVIGIGSFCMLAFRTKARVIGFYSFFGISFGLLVWKADAIYSSLDKLQSYLPTETAVQQQAFRIGTYSERLYGFQNVFRNRSMWTLFGNTAMTYRSERVDDEDIVHDALGQMLVTHGIVGLLLLLGGGGYALVVLHRKILSIPKGPAESLARGTMSTAIAIFFGGMLTGTHLPVFPINMLFWTTAGALLVLAQAKTVPQVEKISPGPARPPGQPRALASRAT